jgi:hypothetical protein
MFALELKAEDGRPTAAQMQLMSDFNAAVAPNGRCRIAPAQIARYACWRLGACYAARTARPHVDTEQRRTVKVSYDVECRNRPSSDTLRFSEEHLVRVICSRRRSKRFAAQSNMRLMASEEFMTGRRPSAPPGVWLICCEGNVDLRK